MSSTLQMSQATRPTGARLLRGALGGLAVNVLTNGFLFIGQLAIPRMLGHTEYAQFTIAVSVVTVIALLADLGLTPLFTRLLTAASEEAQLGSADTRGELLGSMLTLRVGLAVVVSVVILLVTPRLYGPAIANQTTILLFTVFISSRLVVVRAVADALMRSLGKYYLTTVFCLVDAVIFAGLLVMASAMQASLTTVVWIYTFCHLPGFFLLTHYCIRYLRESEVKLSLSFRRVFELLRVGLPLGIGTAFLTLHSESDKLLLDKLSTPFEVANYGATIRLTAAVAPIAIVLGAVAAPELTRLLSRGDSHRARRLVDLSVRLLLVAGSTIALVLASLSHGVILLLLGPKYELAAPLLTQVGWMLIPIFFATFMTEMSIAAGKYWLPTWYTFIIMISVILGDLLLVPAYGAAGAMTSKTLAVSLGGIGLFLLQRDSSYVDSPKMLRSFGGIGLSLFCGLTASFCSRYLNLEPVIQSTFTLAVFALALHWTGSAPVSEMIELVARLRNRTHET